MKIFLPARNRSLTLGKKIIIKIEDGLDRAHRFFFKFFYRILYRLLHWNIYQPAPWVGVSGGQRAQATYSRWNVIHAELENIPPGSALDLGSQLGFFSFKLSEMGFVTLGVEADSHVIRAARLIQSASGIDGVSFRNNRLDSRSVHQLPRVDVTIFLSLWHHICRSEGFESAELVLKEVLGRTRQVCFFETGQSDETYMEWVHELPRMEPSPDRWVADLLKKCGAREVKHLGSFPAYRGNVKRHLFAAYMS